MLKKSFFAFTKPDINYDILNDASIELYDIPVPESVTILSDGTPGQNPLLAINIGDKVTTGQKLNPYKDNDSYVISSATGTISSISPYLGDYGKTYTAISIDVDANETFDETFKKSSENLTLETASNYFAFLPGNLSIDIFSNSEKPINKIIVFGGNTDLLITTNQYVIKSELDNITKGISILKTHTGIFKLLTGRYHLIKDILHNKIRIR